MEMVDNSRVDDAFQYNKSDKKSSSKQIKELYELVEALKLQNIQLKIQLNKIETQVILHPIQWHQKIF